MLLLTAGRNAGEASWLLLPDLLYDEFRDIACGMKGECDRGAELVGCWLLVAWARVPWVMDMERSDVGVLSSTAEAFGLLGTFWFCRVWMVACCSRIMFNNRFCIISINPERQSSKHIPLAAPAQTPILDAALPSLGYAGGVDSQAGQLNPNDLLADSAAVVRQVLVVLDRSD